MEAIMLHSLSIYFINKQKSYGDNVHLANIEIDI